MSRGIGMLPDPLVMKSLRVGRSVPIVVLGSTAGIVTNLMVALQSLSIGGQLIVVVTLFSVLFLEATVTSKDVLERSGQALRTLRSMGAQRTSVLASLVVTLVVFSGAGALLGSGMGILVLGFGGGVVWQSVVLEFLAVTGVSSAAIAAGVYSGVTLSWHN